MTQRVDPPRPDQHRVPEEFWDDLYHRFRDDPAAWGARTNPRLAEIAAALPPGRALDLGCGTGGDALWLARHGWDVLAVDIAATAVDRVARAAAAAGLASAVTTERHDLAASFPGGAFDLISAQYFHTPFEMDRSAVFRTAAHALNPGGRLLIVDHASIAPWSWNQDPDTYFPAPEEVYAGLALPESGWRAERAERAEREAHGPGGQTAVVTDSILLVRKLTTAGENSSR